jgi:hypothetical protein
MKSPDDSATGCGRHPSHSTARRPGMAVRLSERCSAKEKHENVEGCLIYMDVFLSRRVACKRRAAPAAHLPLVQPAVLGRGDMFGLFHHVLNSAEPPGGAAR